MSTTININLLLSSFIYGIIVGGLYALVAVGASLIFGVMRIINLAQGDFVMLGMFTAYWLLTLFGVPALASLPIAFLILFLAGFPIMRFLVKHVLQEAEILAVLLTYGLELVVVNGAQLVWSGDYRAVEVPYATITFSLGPISVGAAYVVAFIFATALFFALYFFLMKTKMGMATRALAQNVDAAPLMGIDVEKTRMISMGIGLGLAGAGGVLLSTVYYTFPYVGPWLTIKAFIICVLGGMGSIIGAFWGALILGLAEALSVLFVPYGFKDAVGFMIFILILSLRPSGLFGKARA